MKYVEVNFDGLVGPNHNYAGLAQGNLASTSNSKNVSHPKAAALQGLEKMKALFDLGVPQAILPPLLRPNLTELKNLGLKGKPHKIIEKAAKTAPDLLAAVYSSSSMWTANCATVTPSCDAKDNKLHLTPANLVSNFHRSIESDDNYNLLKLIFSDKKRFSIHRPLPKCDDFADEGAANHMRLSSKGFIKGLEVFIYGTEKGKVSTKKHSARQSLSASQNIIRNHKLSQKNSYLLKQSSGIIDRGVFHNDVIATSNGNFLLTHESAFSYQKKNLKILSKLYQETCNDHLTIRTVSSEELSVDESVRCYLFNSQIVSLPDGKMLLAAPQECQELTNAKNLIDSILNDAKIPITQVKFFNLKQSMSNGGGPACLRLRILMNKAELKSMNQTFLFNNKLYKKLKKWIQKHYRDELSPKDLADPILYEEILVALDELSQILKTPNLYSFQKN